VTSRKPASANPDRSPWLHELVAVLRQPAVILDNARRILIANGEFYHLLAATPQDAVGRHLQDFGDRLPTAADLNAFLDSAVSGSAVLDHGLEAAGSSKAQPSLTLRAWPLSADLANDSILVLVDERPPSRLGREPDASDNRPAPDDQESSIGAVNHAIRQPLQTLSLLGGILRVRGEHAHLSHLSHLMTPLEEAIEAISGILDTASAMDELAHRSIVPVFTSFPINVVLARLRAEMAYHAASKGVTWRVVASSARVHSDRQLVTLCLRVLLVAAMTLVSRGKVLLGCRRRGDRIVLQIWVAGAASAPEQQRLILERFHRPAQSSRHGRRQREELVKLISDSLGIGVKTRVHPGNGLIFSAEVPAESPSGLTRFQPFPRPRGTILICSENARATDALRQYLHEMGHETYVTSIDDGLKSLNSMTGGMRPELAIIDLQQDHQRWKGVVSSIRWSLGWQIPVIVIRDGASDDEHIADASDAIMYLPRPARPDELEPLVGSLVLLARQRAANLARADSYSVQQTVFVIDDDGVLRDAVRDVLEQRGRTVQAFRDGESFLESRGRSEHGCIIIDDKLPGISGVELLERLSSDGVKLPAIMITGHGDISTAVRAMKAGAIDYIEKPIRYETLIMAVEQALKAERVASDSEVRQKALATRMVGLTPREVQVMELVVAGRSSKNIAQALSISQRTVEHHRAAIMKRVGATSLPELIKIVTQLQASNGSLTALAVSTQPSAKESSKVRRSSKAKA
jgi:two-component system CheB/CheR fusion protein